MLMTWRVGFIASLVYCYSLENDGDLPAGLVPVVGLQLLDSRHWYNRTCLGLCECAFQLFRSQNVKMTRDILLGLATDGAEYIDPTTGFPTRYRYGGDPRTGKVGWMQTAKEIERLWCRPVLQTCLPATVASSL